MKFVTYQVDRLHTLLGVLNQDENWIYPLKSFEIDYKDMLQLIREISEGEMQRIAWGASRQPEDVPGAAPIGDALLLAPIPEPSPGYNLPGHQLHGPCRRIRPLQKRNLRWPASLCRILFQTGEQAVNPGQPILSHSDIVDSLDYEAELAVIIRKDARNVPEEKAREYVFGYTIINDVSARNLQNRHKQWYFGKSLDGFLPMGPSIVTADSLPYPPQLSIQSLVNENFVRTAIPVS